MMNRVLRNVRQKSPTRESNELEYEMTRVGGRRHTGSSFSSGGSPILSRRTSGGGYGLAGLGASYTVDFYKSTTQVCVCF